jgi:putative transposase
MRSGNKKQVPFLTADVRLKTFAHIRENAKSKGIYIDRMNGNTEHLHCLFGFNADMSLSKAMQLLKAESAFWMNSQNLTSSRFEWAGECFASSVSESMLIKVRAYIDRQEEHHRKTSFTEEYAEFMRKHQL